VVIKLDILVFLAYNMTVADACMLRRFLDSVPSPEEKWQFPLQPKKMDIARAKDSAPLTQLESLESKAMFSYILRTPSGGSTEVKMARPNPTLQYLAKKAHKAEEKTNVTHQGNRPSDR